MHWILVGILIFVGFAIAPWVVGAAIAAVPAIIGGVIGLLVGVLVFSDTLDSGGPIIFCTALGAWLPYWLWARSRKRAQAERDRRAREANDAIMRRVMREHEARYGERRT